MTGPSPAIRALVLERDGYRCARCGVDVRTSPVGYSIQHRVARGMGGTRREWINAPTNLVTLCGDGTRGCHGWVEAHPRESQPLGWAVSHYTDPAAVPVHYPGGWWLLTDDGSRRPHRHQESA